METAKLLFFILGCLIFLQFLILLIQKLRGAKTIYVFTEKGRNELLCSDYDRLFLKRFRFTTSAKGTKVNEKEVPIDSEFLSTTNPFFTTSESLALIGERRRNNFLIYNLYSWSSDDVEYLKKLIQEYYGKRDTT